MALKDGGTYPEIELISIQECGRINNPFCDFDFWEEEKGREGKVKSFLLMQNVI